MDPRVGFRDFPVKRPGPGRAIVLRGQRWVVKAGRGRSTAPLWIRRPRAIGRKSYLFAGSDAGGRRAAAIYSLIESAKLNGLNPQHYLADVLACIADHLARRIAELLPWNWQPLYTSRAAPLNGRLQASRA